MPGANIIFPSIAPLATPREPATTRKVPTTRSPAPEKARYDSNEGRSRRRMLHPTTAGAEHARQQADSHLCSVDDRAFAPRLTGLWGRPHETLRHLETG